MGIEWAWYHVTADHAPFRLREGVGYRYILHDPAEVHGALANETGRFVHVHE